MPRSFCRWKFKIKNTASDTSFLPFSNITKIKNAALTMSRCCLSLEVQNKIIATETESILACKFNKKREEFHSHGGWHLGSYLRDTVACRPVPLWRTSHSGGLVIWCKLADPVTSVSLWSTRAAVGWGSSSGGPRDMFAVCIAICPGGGGLFSDNISGCWQWNMIFCHCFKQSNDLPHAPRFPEICTRSDLIFESESFHLKLLSKYGLDPGQTLSILTWQHILSIQLVIYTKTVLIS